MDDLEGFDCDETESDVFERDASRETVTEPFPERDPSGDSVDTAEFSRIESSSMRISWGSSSVAKRRDLFAVEGVAVEEDDMRLDERRLFFILNGAATAIESSSVVSLAIV